MKRRLLCLLMSLMMIGSVLLMASCGEKVLANPLDLNETAGRSTMTLSMYIMTEQPVNEDTRSEITAAVNRITKAKFKTQLVLYFYTESEYYQKLDDAFAEKAKEIEAAELAEERKKLAQREAKARGEKYVEETTAEPETTVEETIKNQYGVTELKYPTLTQGQIDIFYFGGLDRYNEYIDNEWLSALDEELSGASKKLKSYISEVYLDAAKMDGSTYAIPNNTVIGEYTYLLLDKVLLKKYSFDPAAIASLSDIEEFLSDIQTYEKDYAPIKGEIDIYRMHYWGVNPDTLALDRESFSIYGAPYSNYSTLGTLLPFRTVFSSSQYKDQLLTKKLIETSYLVPDSDTHPFAAKVVKGGAELEKVYGEDYEMIVLEAPRAYEGDLYNNMFGVGGYTKSVSRSMEMITYLNTNAEFRNLIQYGIENRNYELDIDGSLTRLNQNYVLNINKTGNVFIAYPEQDAPLDIWDYGKKQNLDAVLDPILGFKIKPEDNLNVELMRKYNEFSVKYKAMIDACETYEELDALLKTINDAVEKEDSVKFGMTTGENAVEKIDNVDHYNLFYLYFEKWYKESGFYVEE